MIYNFDDTKFEIYDLQSNHLNKRFNLMLKVQYDKKRSRPIWYSNYEF